jgi:hypothetical protein
MILEVIVTTMNDDIIKLIENFYPIHENVIYLISHQITKQNLNVFQKDVDIFLQDRQDVSYIYYFEKGLSRNRNRSMAESIGDICLVTDDDIKFKPNSYDIILQSFKDLTDADIITYKTEFPNKTPYKKYKKSICKHTKRSSMRISSFEIAYKRQSIERVGLEWDEHFGLGGIPYTNHMENIFMIDALKLGLKAYLYPKTTVIHPFKNSGFVYSDHLVFSKGAAFYRMFGKLSYILDILYAVKKLRDYSKQLSLFKFIKLSIKGSLDYKRKMGRGTS